MYMAAKKLHSSITLFLILVLCVNLLNVQTVLADGETPTEPPVATQVETEPPTEEATQPPTEPPTEVPVEETPAPVETVPAPEESTAGPVATEATATPIAEILTQVPESTEVVILDEEGEEIPLAATEAAEIAAIEDPMWCPEGVPPGGAGCSTGYNTITELINNMISNTGAYAQNGVIYFTANAGSSLTLTSQGNSLGNAAYNTLNDFSLTLQGGWNGLTGANSSVSGQTSFADNSITIGTSGNPWAGSITLNNISIDSADNTAITVYTTSGGITLNDVLVTNQQNETNTAYLQSTSGNIVVDDSTFDGDNTGGDQNRGFVATTGSGSITISDTTFSDAIDTSNNSTYDGATLSAGTVTLTNVTATNNDGDGITINNANLVTLNNVTASNNGTDYNPTGLTNNDGSGVLINGNTGSTVIINGGQFNNNQEYGVQVGSPANTTIYIQATPTCTGNDGGCYNDTTIFDNTGPVVTPTITGTSGANGWYTGNVTVSWAVSDPESGVKSQSGCGTSNLTSDTTGTDLTCSATNNAGLSTTVQRTIKIDKTPPTAALSITGGTQGANGWYTSDVTVQTSGADAVSGVTCTADQVISTESTGTQVNGSCTNGAGLSTSAQPLTIKLDKTAPVTTLTVTGGTAGSNGWYRSNVTVHTAGTESVSGPITCTADQFQTSETGGTTFNGSCTNDAGLTGSAMLNVKLDKTSPSITYSGRTAPNANGWNKTSVTVSWTCSDSTSGPAADSVSQTVATEGAGQSATGTCSDLAGNTASDIQGGINIDKTAPSLSLPSDITAEATSSAGAAVTYSATVSDNLDKNVSLSCAPVSGSSFPIGPTKVDCSSTDQADNTAADSFLVQVGDTTGPVIASHADVTVEATSSAGAAASYTLPAATDAVEGPVAVTCAPASGANFPLGDTTVTCNASDSKGNKAVPSTFTVHVVDTTAPVLAGHADVTVEATSLNNTVVNYSLPAASDAVDGSVTVNCSPAPGSAFVLGDTTVTCNAADDSGNDAEPTTFTVHVLDTTIPVIAPHADVTAEATSPTVTVVNYTSPAVSDAVDQNIAAACSPASGSGFKLGDTTVTCNASDDSGNQAQATTFVVHVVDTTAPVIAAHADVTVQATSLAGAVVNYTAPNATDAVDGTFAATCQPASGQQQPIGDTTVTCTAVDSHGNEADPTGFTIHVVDTGGPVIAFHADLTVEATSPAGALVTYTAPGATDVVDGPVPVTCAPPSGQTFSLGNTTVTCKATDKTNNTSTGTFVVHVVDTTAPVIAAHADITVEAVDASGATVTYTTPTATDIVDGPLTVSCAPASNTKFALSDTTVTCSATDAHSNKATGTFVVHVVDTTAPVMTKPGDITKEATSPGGAVVSYTSPAANDSVDGPVNVTCHPASDTQFALGNTTVTCNAMDTHQNVATVTFTVHVVDTTPPVFGALPNISAPATSASGATVTFSVTATDLVDTSVAVTCSPESGGTFPLGDTQVTCTATDGSNTATGSFFVNVYDEGGPILSLPGNLLVEATSASGAKVNFSATANDIVDGDVPVECTPASGSTFGFGATQVTCIAWDSSERSNEGSFFVTVQDTTAPAIAPHSDFSTETDSASGVIVTYTSPATTDAVDGTGTASCTPASGTLFPIGDTTVTCTAADSHGNTSTGMFTVHVRLSKPGTGTGNTPDTSGFLIPTTGGPIDLDCDTVLWAYGIKLSFYNLCDYQAALTSVGAADLPGELPAGVSYVMGLDVDILSAGQLIDELPGGAGIQADFPTYHQSAAQFAVLFWSDGKWIEVSEQIGTDEISQALSTDGDLYQILSDELSDLFYQMLATQQAGTFVLVKK